MLAGEMASPQSGGGRAGPGTFSSVVAAWSPYMYWGGGGGVLRSRALGVPPPHVVSRSTLFLWSLRAPQEHAGCLVHPPESESQVPGAVGSCLRTLVPLPGLLEAGTHHAALVPAFSTALF